MSTPVRIAVVASRFNEEIVTGLIEGAMEVLAEAGLDAGQLRLVRVPGALELALAARELAGSGEVEGIVALGCVIRGQTSHFEHVSREAVGGLQRISLELGVPVGIGVLTTDDEQQARARAGLPAGSEAPASKQEREMNRGRQAARACLEMVEVLRDIRGAGRPGGGGA